MPLETVLFSDLGHCSEMRLVLSRRRPAVLALQPCAVWSGVISLLRTGKEDNYLNALMLPVICSGSAEAARLANTRIGTAVRCGSTTVHAARTLGPRASGQIGRITTPDLQAE